MIVVDTSVISELWKIEPNPKVLAWIDAQAVETLYLSAITVAELCYGIATMPEGKRRTVYQQRLEHEVLPVFAGRVLPFDLDASRAYSDLMARARAAGKAIGEACAIVEPSTNSTIECTIDCGCTTTSMRS